ncbi:L-type lectin-domain containing receptor kinase VIII.1 [Elaeis guineensis]|uniref:L-type lectin-domain containing receptor kinase VIII.1 isoform X1 n=1 Tax=Elaeis guineensis var. tenera TaxID=51953 RepID=A0A6I9RA74_ELAGV|nr:L-type lectin-domain containing receptor kinase VIII.1 isoform X1 [Elaeis guineensis]
MAFSVVSRYSPFFVVLFVALFAGLHCESLGKNRAFSFRFERFEKNRSLDAVIALYGDAEISDSVVGITRPAVSSSGRVVYRKPVRFLGRNPGFSTYFAFSVSSPGGGEGLAFFLAPSSSPLKESTNGLQVGLPPGATAVKFATLTGPETGSHIGIEVSGKISKQSSNLSNVSLVLNGGEKVHSWIDYDGDSKRLEVRLSKSRVLRPPSPLVSYPIDLSRVLQREEKLVGISSSSGNSTQTSSVYSWSFSVKQGAPYLMHSEPLDPGSVTVQARESPPIHLRRTYPWGVFIAMAFAAVCGGLVTFFAMFVWFALIARRPVAPVEYPVHPVEVAYQQIELVVGEKGVDDAKK